MNVKKTPSVDINDALVRILLMLVIILIGVLISTAAEAGVRGDKNAYHKVAQKKKSRSYSCEELEERQRGSSNIIVKKGRRPKWR